MRNVSRVRGNPSSLLSDNSQKFQQAYTTARERRQKTINAAKRHHGATAANLIPAVHGLWGALVFLASVDQLCFLLQNSQKAMQAIARIMKHHKTKFEKSLGNKVRSLSLLYRGGVMSKEKYRHTYRSLVHRFCQQKHRKTAVEVTKGVHVDRPLSYDQLQCFMKTVDTGTVLPLPNLPDGNTPNVKGARRSLEDLLLLMAHRCLTVPYLKSELTWLNKEPGHFQYALGGDGAPVNKANNLTMIMVSFLNSGKRVGSPSENFVLAAGDASEVHPVWLEVVRLAVAEGCRMAEKQYAICGMTCRFTPRLVPADQKWLAHFAGELPNSATFFSTFADVSTKEMQLLGKTYSLTADVPASFHPWYWNKRMADVAAVREFRKECAPSMSEDQIHDALLSHLAKVLKSRQIDEPALGKLVQCATADPLHLMNNAWEHFLSCFLHECLSLSHIPKQAGLAPQPQTPLSRFLHFLKGTLHLHRLHKKLEDWVKDNSSKESSTTSLHIRLNGLESRKFCQNVMQMLNCLLPSAQTQKSLLRVHALAFVGLQLRDAVALFSRYSITDVQVDQLEKTCRRYFNACVLFLPRSATPTIWTIGHIVPAQTKQLKQELGFGLGIGTTQGREAKVQVAKKYLAHTTPAAKFSLFFKHEFMHLIWLPKHNPTEDSYHKSKQSYLPKGVQDGTTCHCGQPSSNRKKTCAFCSHEFRDLITRSADEGKLCSELKAMQKQTSRAASVLRF